MGRFLSEDPIGFAAGDVNLSRYVANRATMWVDPSGLCWGTGTGALVGGMIGGGIAATTGLWTGTFSWGKVAGGVASGAVAGAITAGLATGDPSVIGVIGVGALAGGVGGVVGSATEQVIDDPDHHVDPGQLAVAGGLGAVGGAAGGLAGKMIGASLPGQIQVRLPGIGGIGGVTMGGAAVMQAGATITISINGQAVTTSLVCVCGTMTWMVSPKGDPLRSRTGKYTEPQLPPRKIAADGDVTIEHYTRGSDHPPAHAHVIGRGPMVRIRTNGKPIDGEPELTAKQRDTVDRFLPVIRQAIQKINRWWKYQKHLIDQ